MTSGKDIEAALESDGVETDGIIVHHTRGTVTVPGYLADDVPDDVAGYRPVDDPSLTDPS